MSAAEHEPVELESQEPEDLVITYLENEGKASPHELKTYLQSHDYRTSDYDQAVQNLKGEERIAMGIDGLGTGEDPEPYFRLLE